MFLFISSELGIVELSEVCGMKRGRVVLRKVLAKNK